MFVSLFDLRRQLDRAQQMHPSDLTPEQMVSALHLLVTELQDAHRRIDELESEIRRLPI